MPFLLMYWKHLLVVALLATAGAWLYRTGGNAERVENVKAQAALTAAAKELRSARDAIQASEAARKQEADKAKAANAIAEQYEKDKRDAEAAGKRTADDLRAGNLRLRAQWQGCEARRVPASTGAASEPDAAADDRAEGAGRIVRAASEADAQIRALQDFVREALR